MGSRMHCGSLLDIYRWTYIWSHADTYMCATKDKTVSLVMHIYVDAYMKSKVLQ